MRLSDCRAVVTGASGGIGSALVGSLAQQGARMLAVGRDAAALEALAGRHPGRVVPLVADLARAEGLDRVTEHAERFEGLNTLVNAAGVNRFCLFGECDEEDIAAVMTVNVTATLRLTRRVLPLLRARPAAWIVNMGSVFGSIGYPGYAAYSASKFALRGFTEALRRELADTPVRVIYAAPRSTRTAMNPEAVVAMNRELKNRMDSPEAVARQVIRALGRGTEDVYMGWPEKLFVRVNGLLPRLVNRALRRQLPIIQRYARSGKA